MDEIEKLRVEVAQLRKSAEQADAGLALLLGMIMGAMERSSDGLSFNINHKTSLGDQKSQGWAATILKQLLLGQDAMRRSSSTQPH